MSIKFPKRYRQLQSKFIRLCETLVKPQKQKKSQGGGKLQSEIKQFLQSKPCLKVVSDYIPPRFLRVKKVPSYYSFVADDDVAAEIIEIIKKDVSGNTPIIEANPGLGLLTRYMLKAGARKLFIFDPIINPLAPLQQLINDNPERLTVIPSNMFELYKVLAQDKLDDGDRFETMFKEVKFRKWKEDPSLKVIGVLHSANYLGYLLRSIVFQDSFVKVGRVENFLIMAKSVYQKISCSRKVNSPRAFILFSSFFDLDLLGELPRSAFLPWDKGKEEEMSSRVMYFVKITPKRDLFDKFTVDELKVLWYFVQGLCRTRDSKIIAYFENWMPSSGLILIRDGLNPMTEVKDLSVSDVIRLYRIFVSLPDFDEANFIHIQESSIIAETPSEESVESRARTESHKC